MRVPLSSRVRRSPKNASEGDPAAGADAAASGPTRPTFTAKRARGGGPGAASGEAVGQATAPRPATARSLTLGRRRRLHRRLRRLPHALGTAGAAGAIMMLGLLGGAISGKLEHRPHRSAIRTPPVTQAPATTSTTLSAQEAAVVQTVKTSLVEDMTLDIRAQRLDPDVHRRLALATGPAGVARRHTDIALAWAPDKVAAVTARYDLLVRENAANASSPSVTDGAFVVTVWHDVTVTGTSARATCRAHYRLLEPTNPQAVMGAVEQPDTEWTVTMTETTGRWRLEDRSTLP